MVRMWVLYDFQSKIIIIVNSINQLNFVMEA